MSLNGVFGVSPNAFKAEVLTNYQSLLLGSRTCVYTLVQRERAKVRAISCTSRLKEWGMMENSKYLLRRRYANKTSSDRPFFVPVQSLLAPGRSVVLAIRDRFASAVLPIAQSKTTAPRSKLRRRPKSARDG